MKKMFVALAISTLAGCTVWQEDTQSVPQEVVHPRLVNEVYANMMDEEASAAQAYSVAAARVANRMLNETADVYERADRPKLYVMQIKKAGIDYIPDGFYHARQTTRDIISGAGAFTLVNTPGEADYWLDITVSRLNVNGVPGSVVQYKVVLLDNNNNEVGSWMESIRQVQNDDRSWW